MKPPFQPFPSTVCVHACVRACVHVYMHVLSCFNGGWGGGEGRGGLKTMMVVLPVLRPFSHIRETTTLVYSSSLEVALYFISNLC